MNELVKISTTPEGRQTVRGRELHAALKIGTAYDVWFNRLLEYGFEEGKDFSSFLMESSGGRPATGHLYSLDMAKEIAMLQKTEIGRQIRRYFIEAEKQLWTQADPAKIVQLESEIDIYRQKLQIFEEHCPAKKIFGIPLDGAFTNVIMFTSVSNQKGGAASHQDELQRVSGFQKKNERDLKKRQVSLVLPCRNTFECGFKILHSSKESSKRLTKSRIDCPKPRNKKSSTNPAKTPSNSSIH